MEKKNNKKTAIINASFMFSISPFKIVPILSAMKIALMAKMIFNIICSIKTNFYYKNIQFSHFGCKMLPLNSANIETWQNYRQSLQIAND
jgi:hypothetical protein